MPLLTFVARVTDGMLLVASLEYNPMANADSQETLEVYKSQAKQIFKKLNPRSVAKMSIDSGSYTFHYMITFGICYLTLCDKGYPKRLAFLYLEDIHNEFVTHLTEIEEMKARDENRQKVEWHRQIDTVARPYAFIKFDKTIKKIGKEYSNPQSRSNTGRLNDDLADIHNIMKKNINEVLKRGEALDSMAESSRRLKGDAGIFKTEAKKLSLMALWQQYAPFVVVAGVLLLVLLLKWLF